MSHQLGLRQDPRMNEYNPKVDSSAKTKCRRFEQSTLSRKSTFKVPTPGLKDKVFYFGKIYVPRILLRTARLYTS